MTTGRAEFRAARSGMLVFLAFAAFFLALGVLLALRRGIAAAEPFLVISILAALLVVMAFQRYRIRCESGRLVYRTLYGSKEFNLRRLTGFEIAVARSRSDPTVGLYLASGPNGRYLPGKDLVINVKSLSAADIQALLRILEAARASARPG